MNNSKSLQHYVNVSWLMSGLLALAATVILFVGFALHNYSSDIKVEQAKLNEKAQTVARRLSGELLLGDRGAPKAVALEMAKELGLEEVIFDSPSAIEKITSKNELLYSTVKTPFLENQFSIRVAANKRSLIDYFNFSVMFICFTIIGVLIGVGIFIQTKYLKKHLVRPIQALVETSTGEKIVCGYWPKELQEISERLNQSFIEREQAVYSQVASGVIHDLRTLLQSLQVATDLATEKNSEARLNNLYTVCKSKLPSLLGIINTALDGSREIKIRPEVCDLKKTLESSIETNEALALSKKVELDLIESPQDLNLSHDSIQLERVFTNLIKNAIEAVGDSSGESKVVKMKFDSVNSSKVNFVIEDNGPGLPLKPEIVLRPFKSSKSHGFGLGLFISKKIIEAHGGNLIAGKSIELKGAKFVVELPRRSEVHL